MSESRTFVELIEQYVRDAEAHMKLPDGTISNAWEDSDFLYVVKMCAVLEPLLKEAVREHVKRNMEGLSSFRYRSSDTLIKEIGDLNVDKLRKILVELGSISQVLSDFLYALFQVRHRYAHHIANAHLTVPEVCDKIAESGGDATLLDKLLDIDKPVKGDELKYLLRAILGVKIGLVLQAALHLAKPPPPLPTFLGSGLLGGSLFETPLALKPKEVPPP